MYKIIPEKSLAAMFAALNSDGTTQSKFDAVCAVMAELNEKAMPLAKCHFVVGGVDGHDQAFILPSSLVKDRMLAGKVMNDAIIEANRVTRQGSLGGYFEALSEALAPSGILALKEPIGLACDYLWDSDCANVLGDLMDDDSRVEVVITNATDVLEHGDSDMFEARINGNNEEVEEVMIRPENVVNIRVTSIGVFYPRSDRYGVPESATDRGAREYVRDLGFIVGANVDVFAEDTYDDSVMTFQITGKVSDALIIRSEPKTSEAPAL